MGTDAGRGRGMGRVGAWSGNGSRKGFDLGEEGLRKGLGDGRGSECIGEGIGEWGWGGVGSPEAVNSTFRRLLILRPGGC